MNSGRLCVCQNMLGKMEKRTLIWKGQLGLGAIEIKSLNKLKLRIVIHFGQRRRLWHFLTMIGVYAKRRTIPQLIVQHNLPSLHLD